MTDPLSKLDRATLKVWRVTNVVGWWLAAVVVNVVIMMADASVHDQTFRRPGLASIEWIVHLGFLIVAGLAVGGLVGAKVWLRPPLIAAVVTIPLALPAVWSSFGVGGEGGLRGLQHLFTIAAAVLCAHYVARTQKV